MIVREGGLGASSIPKIESPSSIASPSMMSSSAIPLPLGEPGPPTRLGDDRSRLSARSSAPEDDSSPRSEARSEAARSMSSSLNLTVGPSRIGNNFLRSTSRLISSIVTPRRWAASSSDRIFPAMAALRSLLCLWCQRFRLSAVDDDPSRLRRNPHRILSLTATGGAACRAGRACRRARVAGAHPTYVNRRLRKRGG